MKTAEDFRRDFGRTDESFERCIRQTLHDLQCEEEQPVKKKLSLGLALAMAMVLLTAGALAAGRLGILDFAELHGETASPDRLVTQQELTAVRTGANEYASAAGQAYYEASHAPELVDVTVEEILYEEGWLYAALLLTPEDENTLIIPDEMQQVNEETGEVYLHSLGNIRDISEPGTMQQFAEQLGADPQLSIREYAEEKGYDSVVRVAVASFLKHADYELLQDGSLRMLVQMEYQFYIRENFPAETREVWIFLDAVKYDGNGHIPLDYNAYDRIELRVAGPILTDERSRSSIPDDAHQIEGYRGYIERVSVTPLSETETSVIIQLDQQKRHYGVTQMSGPVVVILDENGTPLHEEALHQDIDKMFFLAGDSVMHNIVMPSAGLTEGKITIRLQSWRNHTIVYDEYTYTLE